MGDMIARQSAPQTVEIHQASPEFAAPREVANFLRRARGDGAQRIGERKMPACPGRFTRLGVSMKIWTQKTGCRDSREAEGRPNDATHSV
jgi:hypothetical protein